MSDRLVSCLSCLSESAESGEVDSSVPVWERIRRVAAGAGCHRPQSGEHLIMPRIKGSMHLLVKGGILFSGFILAVSLAEGFVRVFFPDWGPRTAEIARFWAYDASLGWSHIPNAKGTFRALGDETFITINSKGFRDIERTYERDRSQYRIVVLGDSLVWGYGVNQQETFTALLEQNCPGMEVINLGVSGYGTDQELILLQKEGIRFRPDLVVVVITPNDFQTNVQTKAYLVYHKPVFELSNNGLRLTNIPVPTQKGFERVGSMLMRYSFLLNKVASTYHGFALTVMLRESGIENTNRDGRFPRNHAEDITVAMLLHMGMMMKEQNAELVLIMADGMGGRGEDMEKLFRSRAIRIVNMDHDFRKSYSEKLHLGDGLHWNAAGHRKVADRFVRYLQDEKLIVMTDRSKRMCQRLQEPRAGG